MLNGLHFLVPIAFPTRTGVISFSFFGFSSDLGWTHSSSCSGSGSRSYELGFMIRKVLRADGSGAAGSYLGWKSRRSCVGMGETTL